ncbi:MAG: FHA domain-containing protein [Verrucomicrobiales bacterium]
MPKIHFVFPDGAEARFSLEGDSFTIGRAPDNDIVIPDPRVSSHHLILKRSQSGNFIVNDLGATNPTRVNGRTSSLAELSDGDTLMLGDTYARYESPATAAPRPPGRPGRSSPSEELPAARGCFAVLLATALLTGVAGAVWMGAALLM